MVNIVFFLHLLANIFIVSFGVGAFVHTEFYTGLLSIIAWGVDMIYFVPFIKGRAKVLPASTFLSHLTPKNVMAFVRWSVGFLFVMSAVSLLSDNGFTSQVISIYIAGIAIFSPLDGIIFDSFRDNPKEGFSQDIKVLIGVARSIGFFLVIFAVMLSGDDTAGPGSNGLIVIGIPLLLAGPLARWILRMRQKNVAGMPQSDNTTPSAGLAINHVWLQKPTRGDTSQSVILPDSSINIEELKRDFIAISTLEPQKRGYAFQDFLNRFFDAHNFSSRTAFRTTGEEIDGSFEIESQIYLLEAKWQTKPCGQADLLVFNGKVEGKSTWARGIFISYAGFSEEGLQAFSRGKRTSIIGMDGQDILHILNGEITLLHAIKRKARRAVETNGFFVPVQELIR
ncbi:restriction endonuclease [Dawidia soli]|uniref:Restriction endonuclease type IV Mrr domain-containing protein n=1 Tax=Dawidia soli TaxID=2782352 RepID=A0AAP2D7I2_9BACT|nr:restriction endonuclease [Dawidia soli]MBT1686851.1 hypothetical protein [Dawidia soli]